MWDNPLAILAILAVIISTAFLLSRKRNIFLHRGIPRCYSCTDGAKTKYKVAYKDQSTAESAANRYRQKFGPQHAYFQPTCGYWHLTSQQPRQQRRPTKARSR